MDYKHLILYAVGMVEIEGTKNTSILQVNKLLL